jgi:hypothetical protein
MPDRDVFDRNVSRGWVRAAHLTIGHDGNPDALRSVIRALGQELKREGCPGLDAVVGIVIDAYRSTDRQLAQERACDQLDRLRCDEASSTTEIAVAAAKRLLIQPPLCCDNPLPVTIAAHLLAELADARMCPAPLLAELVESGDVSIQTIQFRRKRVKSMLAAAPETQRLAELLLADPSGASVKTPRMRRPEMSQADILLTALTD